MKSTSTRRKVQSTASKIEAALNKGMTPSAVALKYNVTPSYVYVIRKRMTARPSVVIEPSTPEVVPVPEAAPAPAPTPAPAGFFARLFGPFRRTA